MSNIAEQVGRLLALIHQRPGVSFKPGELAIEKARKAIVEETAEVGGEPLEGSGFGNSVVKGCIEDVMRNPNRIVAHEKPAPLMNRWERGKVLESEPDNTDLDSIKDPVTKAVALAHRSPSCYTTPALGSKQNHDALRKRLENE